MLLGRQEECARIAALLADARAGKSGVLLLRGEPGIGKTALLEYAIAEADEMTLVAARGVESESEIAFGALAELVQPLLDHLDALPPPQRAALAGALALGPPVPADPFAIAAATLSLLAAGAEDGSLLAVIDDAHWLDTASGEALAFAARRLEREGVAILVATRHRAGSSFDRVRFSELVLTGLDDDAAHELLALHPRRISPDVAETVLRTARGNPLALLEIPSVLTDAELAGKAPITDPLPVGEALERSLARELEALSEPVKLALLVAAASDAGSTHAIAAAVQTLGGDAAALTAAEAAGLIMLGDDLRFRHPLVRAAVYHGAPAANRRAAHRALADVLSSKGDDYRRAWHLALASSGPNEEAAAALEAAAFEARERTGHAAAARAFERAANLTSADEIRCRRSIEAARDWLLAGRYDQVADLLAVALASTRDPVVRAEIDTLRARREMFAGDPMFGHTLLVNAAASMESVDRTHSAMLFAEATFPVLVHADARLGLETAQRAHTIAEQAGGDAAFMAEITLAAALLMRGEAKGAEEILDRWLPMLERADPLRGHHLMLWPALTLVHLERYADGRRIASRLIEAARHASALAMLPFALGTLATAAFRTGSWHLARAAATESANLAEETGQANQIAYFVSFLAQLDAAQGRVDECREHVDRAVELGRSGYGAGLLSWVNAPLASLALSSGDTEETIAHLEPVARVVSEHGVENPCFVWWPPDLVEAYARSGRTNDASAALTVFDRQAERTGLRWARAAVARCRGLLAPENEFERHFEDAVRWHDETSTPFERARTELCLGERRRRARRRADARPPLRSALATFDRLGARIWAERARAELLATGETARRRDPPLSERLTAQELRVALAVSEGATNQEAAAALFLSAKTIEFHLRNVYRKLGIRSRSELVRLLSSEASLPTS